MTYYGARIATEAQFLVVARKPEGWTVGSNRLWNGLNQELKSIKYIDVAGVICRSELAAKTIATKCRNLGLEVDYAKLEDVLQ